MKLKQYHRYHMNFSGVWIKASSVLMGVSLFLLAVYYFGMTSLSDHSVIKTIFCLFLPLFICVAYILLLRILRWDAPGVYALLGAALCMVFLISVFFAGSFIRILLGVIWYILSALVLLAAVGGYLPGRLPATVFFGIAILVRLIFFDIGKLGLTGWIGEGATLCAMASLLCLPMAMVPVHSKQK